MIYQEVWYKEAFGEKEISLLVKKIQLEAQEHGEVSEALLEELTHITQRSGQMEEVLGMFPKDFPIFLEPVDRNELDYQVERRVHEDFSDWVPGFDEGGKFDIKEYTNSLASGDGVVRAGRPVGNELWELPLTVTVEVEGFYEVDTESNIEENDEEEEHYPDTDVAFDEQFPALRDSFLQDISNPHGYNVENPSVIDHDVKEGSGGAWGFMFTGQFTYETFLNISGFLIKDPQAWKLVYDPNVSTTP